MRIHHSRKFLLLLFCTIVFLPTQIALADTGPKPSMEFTFTGESLAIISGVMYECDQSDCSDAAPLEELGPQGFRCEPSRCGAIGYGFAPYHIIEIEFSDGVARQSNIFQTAGFDSKYTVTVRPDDLLVEARFSFGLIPRTGTFLALCACAFFAVFLVVAGVVFFLRRRTAA